jgi:tetratricopeptide (TPR) repeat protein
VPGIKLNIGLAYYRQNKFQQAIPAFESVVKRSPESTQARYLLGLCYFFTQNYSAAAEALEPLQQQELNDLNYLYVLAISAWKSKQPEIEQRAMARLLEVGGDTPEFHLLMGKAHFNREEYDDAIKELQLAAQASPKLPFVHFYLGLSEMKKQNFDGARAEFLKDSEIEPDVPYNYDQLGVIAVNQQHMNQAEEYFNRALSMDPNLASSRYQLARVYQINGEYTKALSQADATLKLQPDNSSVHYLRGQILQHLRRTEEAKAEMQKAAGISNQARLQREKELENPEPDLRQAPEP